jgi:uncharacterized membrane protein YraQ (UPF0718 family)
MDIAIAKVSVALPGELSGRHDPLVRWARCNARLIVLGALGFAIAGTFWFGSRYPALLVKAHQIGHAVPSMAYGHEIVSTAAADTVWKRILYGTLNWLEAMRVGMTFGVLFGALLHTVLRYYPLHIGRNYTLNSFKGALVGAPMGVCANCAVPMACGVTRGNGRVEVALGYLFSSPTFNPVVVAMTFAIMPWYFGVTKYALVCFLILVLVPRLIGYLESRQKLAPLTTDSASSEVCLLVSDPCSTPVGQTLKAIARDYAASVWTLTKLTVGLMLVAGVVSSALLVLVPWEKLLASSNPLYIATASMLSVFMPVPIALDVMFAAQLYAQGVNPGYVMLFLGTLGTYSVIPAVYLWREVSRPLAMYLFAFFVAAGTLIGLLFSWTAFL